MSSILGNVHQQEHGCKYPMPFGSGISQCLIISYHCRCTEQIDYAIVAGNDGGKFRIGQGSGTVRTNGTFDFETQSTYSLTIQAQDRGTPALSSNVTMNVTLLDVNDNRPILANTTLSVTIPRNTSVGAVIANFYATDADTGLNAQLTYTAFQQSIGSVPIIDPGLSLFVVNESTGAVSIGRSLCAADMREATQMTLQIQVGVLVWLLHRTSKIKCSY